MAGERALPIQEYCDDSQVVVLTTLTDFNDGHNLLCVPDRDIIVDHVHIAFLGADNAVTVTIDKQADGVTVGSGTAVATLVFGSLAADTIHAFTVDEDENIVAAGERLVWNETGATNIASAALTIRFRSKRR